MSAQPHELQGTNDWLQWRRTRGGASEIAALLGCSPYFPRTPLELFNVKTGRAEVYVNAAMRAGNLLEAAARSRLEANLGEVFEPQVVEDGRIIASLDGLVFDGDLILEIKIPAAGRDSELWAYVDKHKQPPEHYLWQCRQQLMVARARRCIFAVMHTSGDDITDFICCTVYQDTEAFERIRGAWAEFFSYLDADQPPPMTDRDVIERGDGEWADAAIAYRLAKNTLKNAERAEKAARERLQELAGEQSSKGCGVAVTRFWRSGGTDWKKAAIEAGADGAGFEKQGAWQWRISEAKEQ